MLRSKATAALMKLKEIDRKYKIKCSEDVKVLSSLSDISTIDSGDEVSNHVVEPAGSGDRPDSIITSRPKLDIRMPDAHMERAAAQGTESKLVTIFNKPKKLSPKLDSDISPNIITVNKTVEETNASSAGEENDDKLQMICLQNSLTISEEKTANAESSISEDVSEVVSSSHPKTNSSPEITLKSAGSMSDVEEKVQSDVDEDPSTLVASGTYSDDFVKTFSETSSRARDLQPSGNARESKTRPGKSATVTRTEDPDPELTSTQVKYLAGAPPGASERQYSPKLNEITQPEPEEIVEQISAKVLRVVSDCDASSDSSLSNFMKKTDRSGNKQAENPVCLLQKSSQSSSARSSEERRTRQRPRTVSSCRNSPSLKSREVSSSSGQTKDTGARHSLGSSDPSESNLHSGLILPESNHSEVLETTRPQDTQFTVLFARKHEKQLKNSETVSFLEAKSISEDHHETDDKEVSRRPKNQAVAVIRREKLGSKAKSKNLKNSVKDGDSSIEEPPPNYSTDHPMQKCKSSIQPVPITSVRPVSESIQSPNDDEVARLAKRTSKHRAIHHDKKGPANKPKIGGSLRSKHRNKTERISQTKTRVIEEPGRRDVERLKQQINELRLQQARDQLQARVRGYVQQLMNEKQGLLARDDVFRGSIDQCDYSRSTTGSRQSESLRSFFKPLDLPNVAAFKRPDFEDEQAADLDCSVRNFHLRMIRERVLDIRHWLKQQFVLYKDYSSLVATINAKYIPVTLKETKKMIRDMQRFHNNCERRRHVR